MGMHPLDFLFQGVQVTEASSCSIVSTTVCVLSRPPHGPLSTEN